MSYFALSVRGLRALNEDSYCAERIGDYYVFVVADGLGGHACGEVASGIAIDCLKNAMESCGGDIKNVLRNAVLMRMNKFSLSRNNHLKNAGWQPHLLQQLWMTV
jgi:serine/threonine protein phosphatase PrpC